MERNKHGGEMRRVDLRARAFGDFIRQFNRALRDQAFKLDTPLDHYLPISRLRVPPLDFESPAARPSGA